MNTFPQQDSSPAGARPRRSGGLRLAFTLIELLAVISIIAVLAGIFGMALGRGNSAQALPGAQSTLFSLVSSARAQAILHQTNSMLLVYANSNDGTHNLNYLQVVYQDPATNNWVASSDGVVLPAGVYVVPASTPSYTATSQFPALPSGSGWPTQGGSVTICLPPATGTPVSTSGSTSAPCYCLGFNQFGAPVATTSPYGTLAISTGAPTAASPNAPTFNNPQNVRGLTLTQLGTPILLNSTTDFP